MAEVVLTEQAFREIKRMYYDTKRMHRNLVSNLANGTRRMGGARFPSRVKFLNNSSETAPAWGVLRITGGSSNDYLTIDKPDSTYRWLYLVNGNADVATGKTGFGTFLTAENFSAKRGRVLVSGTPAYGEEWGPTASQWYLSQSRPGFFIFGGYNSTKGTVLALQQPPGEILVYNATGSSIAAGSSGTATLYGGTAGSEASLSLTVTAYNRSSTAWANAKYATADLINGQVYVSPQQT